MTIQPASVSSRRSIHPRTIWPYSWCICTGCSTSIRSGVNRAASNARRRLAHPTASAGATAPSPANAVTSAAAPSTASSRSICGHVFCSFLALVLRDELYRRMDNAGVSAEWGDILRDLNALSETTITYNGKSCAVRSNAVGVAGKIAQCVGVRLPNTVRQIEFEEGNTDPGS